MLLRHAIKDARNNGVHKVEVDDMSDRYGKDHNIYVNCGFQYVELEAGPEMIMIL